MRRKVNAIWKGNGADGNGTLTAQSGLQYISKIIDKLSGLNIFNIYLPIQNLEKIELRIS